MHSLPLKWFMVFLVIGVALFLVSVMTPRE